MKMPLLARRTVHFATAAILTSLLGACSNMQSFSLPSFGDFASSSQPVAPPEPPPEPEIPSSIRPDEIVGRWGLAAYHKPEDKARTEVAARAQCKQPYVINPGSSGGVIMHLPDEPTPQELRMKGSRTGKNYIGPRGPVAGEKDREIVSFDGRVMITRFMDKDANTRYGSMVYVRCGPKA
jgi:hypothetical protein